MEKARSASMNVFSVSFFRLTILILTLICNILQIEAKRGWCVSLQSTKVPDVGANGVIVAETTTAKPESI